MFLKVMKSFQIDCSDACTTLSILKTAEVYTLGMSEYAVCKLHLMLQQVNKKRESRPAKQWTVSLKRNS